MCRSYLITRQCLIQLVSDQTIGKAPEIQWNFHLFYLGQAYITSLRWSNIRHLQPDLGFGPPLLQSRSWWLHLLIEVLNSTTPYLYLGDPPAGRKMFSWFRASSKSSHRLPSTTALPSSLQYQGHSRRRKGFFRPKDAHKAAQAPVPFWKRVSSKSEPLASQVGSSQPWPSYRAAQRRPPTTLPSAPPLWKPCTAQQGSPQKQERIFLTWPPFPSSPASSGLLHRATPPKPRDQGRQRRVPLILPSSPASSALLPWDAGPAELQCPPALTKPLAGPRRSYVWVWTIVCSAWSFSCEKAWTWTMKDFLFSSFQPTYERHFVWSQGPACSINFSAQMSWVWSSQKDH